VLPVARDDATADLVVSSSLSGSKGRLTTVVHRGARVGVHAAFAAHAAIAASWGPRLPLLKQQANVTQTDLGLVLAGLAAGLFVGTRVAGWPVARLGSRGTIRLGIPLLAATLLGVAIAKDAPSLAAAFVANGLASGLLDVANNAQAVAVERDYGRSLMHGIHGTWSAGMLGAGAVAALAARLDVSLSVHFGMVALAVIVVGLVASRRLLPGSEGIRESNAPRPQPPHGRSQPLSGRKAILILGLVGFSSFLAEGVAADWSAVYFYEDRGAATSVAAIGFVAFALGMTVSRFVGDALVARFGPVAATRAAAAGAAAGFILGVALPVPGAMVAFALIGFALGPVVPVAFSAAGNSRVGRTTTALGWVVTVSYAGSILGPVMIGAVAGLMGLRVALLLPVAFAAAIFAAAGSLRPADHSRIA
jgi:MFS family permease